MNPSDDGESETETPEEPDIFTGDTSGDEEMSSAEECTQGSQDSNAKYSEGEDETAMDDDAKEKKIWYFVLARAIDSIDGGDSNPQELLLEPKLTNILVPAVRNMISNLIMKADQLRETNVYIKIQDTVEKLSEKGYDSLEAEQVGWEKRKHLIKNMLMEMLEENDSQTSSDEDGNEDIDEASDKLSVIQA